MSDSPTELELLKERADKIGIAYHSAIGLEKLKTKVNAALTGDAEEETASKTMTKEESETISNSQSVVNDASKLVRINVTCMNPNKKEWFGEVFTISNSLGRWRKFVPFNSDEGYHVPNIIYQFMKERKCQIFVNKKNDKGEPIRTGKIIKEFAIDLLEPLTKVELDNLRKEQAARQGME
jgi:hypothetical protein